MSLKSSVVVTGGVDAGKSTLIGRLLVETGSLRSGCLEDIWAVSRRLGRKVEYAYLLDSFEEERQQELTLDTTQVFCKAGRKEQILFIDVPGHRELMSNMLSGASYADAAVLVVDIGSALDARALSHAWILKFLGIESIIVAVNKMDSVDYSQERFDSAKDELSCLFDLHGISPRAIIPIAARCADNLVKRSRSMAWYKGPVLFDLLKARLPKTTSAGFRMAVQDTYKLDGCEFAVGSILGGEVKRKEAVEIYPAGNTCTVRSLRMLDAVPRAKYPQAVGIELDGIAAVRGQIICKSPLPQTGRDLAVKLFCITAFDRQQGFTLRCATQLVTAHCTRLSSVWNVDGSRQKGNDDGLAAGDIAGALVSCSAPLVFDTLPANNALSRFVIHQREELCAFGLIERLQP